MTVTASCQPSGVVDIRQDDDLVVITGNLQDVVRAVFDCPTNDEILDRVQRERNEEYGA